MQKYSDLLRILLEKRGIIDEKVDIFLNPNYERDLHDPFLMKDMESACVRLFEALENNEKIVIYADYDSDGIPGAVILTDLFKKINYKNYEVYIPGRNNEGYGLNMDAVKEFSQNNTKLLITVDLGITAVEEIAQAEVFGIDTIITDHHEPLSNLPRAYAILNPKTDNYPEKMLCGAGVVFKFIQAFIKKYGEFYKIHSGWEKWSLDMAGLATISDLVPLIGENRTLTFFGLKVLRKTKRIGLQKLMAKMNLKQKYLSEDDISFMISPKLNAASRMDDPHRAYELLSTEDEAEAGALVDHLLKINDQRKLLVASIMREVNKKMEKREDKEIIVIGNPIWKIGVLGLVAGKISDHYQKPVFVWGRDENELIKGSCRSNDFVSVFDLMEKNKELFIEYGGHEMAGGFTVADDKIHLLESALSESFKELVQKSPLDSLVEVDLSGRLDLVKMKNWQQIEKLAPFGLGNKKPVFSFPKVQIDKIKKFGKNGSEEHLEITFSDEEKNSAIAIAFFSETDSFQKNIEEKSLVDLYATFDLSRFRGREELRLRIVDIS